VLPVGDEAIGAQPAHVLQQQSLRLYHLNLADGPGEEAALVSGTSLPVGDGERRTWNTSGQEVDPDVF
jgi:hypothetical protein